MKQKDFALIAVIAFISAIISLVVSNKIFVSPTNRQQQVEVVSPISTDFPKPDTAYFNEKAFDPAKPITVSQNANTNPFSSTSH